MTCFTHPMDFSTLQPRIHAPILRQRLSRLIASSHPNNAPSSIMTNAHLSIWQEGWQKISTTKVDSGQQPSVEDSEQAVTDWLIDLFNTVFAHQKVVLVRSQGEPEYFPATATLPARIEFAHGFFASALHEISHWCIAGEARRQLADFGYWYAPDGRSEAQQQAFERVEIKPQALECLFTLACGRVFRVSQDNLFADFDTSGSTFALNVYQQAEDYIARPHTLPRDAKTLLHTFLCVCN